MGASFPWADDGGNDFGTFKKNLLTEKFPDNFDDETEQYLLGCKSITEFYKKMGIGK